MRAFADASALRAAARDAWARQRRARTAKIPQDYTAVGEAVSERLAKNSARGFGLPECLRK